MTTGAILLRRFLKKTGRRPADISRDTGIDPSLLSRWLRGEDGRRPGLEHACLLEEVTRGAVPACSWMKSRTDRAA